jgi:hypothetical protein
LSRNLKPTHHILKYLKENLENKLNGMVRILGKHGEFNRVEFGNALWTSVIRPCIAHGCSIWLPSSEAQRNLLQNIQYKAAKIILRTKINIPISALLFSFIFLLNSSSNVCLHSLVEFSSENLEK